jgi:hypothetical protein
MNPMQALKADPVLVPQAVTTTAVSGTVDTLGYEYATIMLHLDTAAASSVITTCAVSDGPTTSAFTTLSAFTGGTAWTFPTPNTSTSDVILLNVDMAVKQRYLKVSLASTTSRICDAVCLLSRAQIHPDSATEHGATVVNG